MLCAMQGNLFKSNEIQAVFGIKNQKFSYFSKQMHIISERNLETNTQSILMPYLIMGFIY